jgi:glycosyltransferase involved in cell wall biosynthesis
MSNAPTLSIIIPAYNAERYLAEALDSVLAQAYPINEIIIVDNASTDRTAEIARSYPAPARCLHQPEQGIAPTRNLGVRESCGAVLAFLDADDRWEPTKLEAQMKALADDPTLSIVFTYVQQFISPELSQAEKDRLICPKEPMRGILPSSFMARRTVFDQIGLFDEELIGGEFIDWYARAQEAGFKARVLPDVLTWRRLHTTNHSIADRQAKYTAFAHILKNSLDRRRNQA